MAKEKWLDIIDNPELYSISEIKGTIMKLEAMISILEDELDDDEREFSQTLRKSFQQSRPF
tara:strand:+ start:464 stop:646 length:183 start_codon:yes stop_codon:yes gene_type:complete